MKTRFCWSFEILHELLKSLNQVPPLKINVSSYTITFRNSHRRCSVKKALAQLSPCEFCEISKNTFTTEHIQVTKHNLLYFPNKIKNSTHSSGKILRLKQ